jgi:hypothetical protein
VSRICEPDTQPDRRVRCAPISQLYGSLDSESAGEASAVWRLHAGKAAQVTAEADIYEIIVDPGITITAPRITSRDIRRHRASR